MEKLQGESSWFIDNYNLAVEDVQKKRRNFPGVDIEQHYTMEDIVEGDHDDDTGRGGMTETDADTSGHKDGPYTEINQKKGKWSKAPKNKLSATTDMYNTDKSRGFAKLRNGKVR